MAKGDAALPSWSRNLNPRRARDMTFQIVEVPEEGLEHSKCAVIAAARGSDTGFGLGYAAAVERRYRTPGLRDLDKTAGSHSLGLSAHHKVCHIHH